MGLTIGFIVLRAAGVYGDPRPWEIGDAGLVAALSFLNTNKYPPSLLYLMMTGAARSLVAQLFVTLQEPFGVRAARLVTEEPGVRI